MNELLKRLLISGGVLLSVGNAWGATDAGVRGGVGAAGQPLTGLTERELMFFEAGKEDFEELEGVVDGLGPAFNGEGCVTCHMQPAAGGTSPALNPLVTMPGRFPANVLPSFITPQGPIREARFKYNYNGNRDGSVHNLFVISGSQDAAACRIGQDDFARELVRNNVSLRIPTPLFGAGLIEQIPDSVLLANQKAQMSLKRSLGIHGRFNRMRVSGSANTGSDGTISRFGWKAQNSSLLAFSGEAYNVEMGITNELFPVEREDLPECMYAEVPNDVTNTGEVQDFLAGMSAIEKFAFFMRFLAPPIPSADTPGGATSIANGRKVFEAIGCGLCHTPRLYTAATTVAALRGQSVNLFSDILLHGMGPGLADDIVQGDAAGDEFRTAPLWGLGQRIFFLHDGRTSDLVEAIQLHHSPGTWRFRASEANAVVERFRRLRDRDQQDLLNFLRSL